MGNPRAPAGLKASGKSFWRSVLAVYDLSPTEIMMLGRACRSIDLLDEIDVAIADYGVVSTGSRGQVVPNRLIMSRCEVERNLDMLVRALALPMPDETTGTRRTRSAAAAANARWRGDRGEVAL